MADLAGYIWVRDVWQGEGWFPVDDAAIERLLGALRHANVVLERERGRIVGRRRREQANFVKRVVTEWFERRERVYNRVRLRYVRNREFGRGGRGQRGRSVRRYQPRRPQD